MKGKRRAVFGEKHNEGQRCSCESSRPSIFIGRGKVFSASLSTCADLLLLEIETCLVQFREKELLIHQESCFKSPN